MENNQARFCSIEAPCKINLHLAIGEKRPDGFHNLESIFASLSLADSLTFERCGKSSRLFVNWELPAEFIPKNPIPQEKNLILRAVSLFQKESGFKDGLEIHLIKRIPLGSGLGGGSSDAASTLLALNSLCDSPLPMEKLTCLALILGSDVPFFLKGGTAFVRGRGEKVEKTASPSGLWSLLVNPPFPSDTASAFRLLDRARKAGSLPFRTPIEQLSRGFLIQALKEAPESWPFFNDFLPLFLGKGEKSLVYQGILENLQKTGACFTGISGSGSCCYGIFDSKPRAEKAAKTLAVKGNITTLTFFLAQKPNAVVK